MVHLMAFEEAQGFGGAFVDVKYIAYAVLDAGGRVTIAHSHQGPWWDELTERGVNCIPHSRWDLAEKAALDERGQQLPRVARMGLYGLDVAGNQLPLAMKSAAWMMANDVTHVLLNNGLAHNAAGAVAAKLAGLPLYPYFQGVTRQSLLQDTMVPWATQTFAVSDWTAEANHAAGIDKETCLTLYPGVDSLPDEALCVAPESGRVRVGMVGMFTPWKGQLAFLEAFGRAYAEYQGMEAWLFGGRLPGAEAYFESVQRRIAELGLQDAVRIVDDRRSPDAIYPDVHFTVHSSIEPEPFGRVIIEAMSYERPIIAADAGGPRESVIHGKTGYLAAPEDPDRVADHIVQLASNGTLRETMGAAAREHVAQNFTYPGVLEPLLEKLGL